MALCSVRIRRALSLSSTLHHFLPFHHPKSPVPAPSTTQLTAATAPASFSQPSRPFTSTTILSLSSRFRSFNPETDEIGPETILFEGCDYNHWLITIDFPKDPRPPREEMIEFYVNTAAQVFGSVEEAKKKIYALSTTTYDGFQVECSEETSEKFKNLPGVVFVLPDSYIDPINEEYGGDKYVNGEILTRPPPIRFDRHIRDRRLRERMPYQQRNTGYNNEGPMHDGQNYGPPRHQNYGPPRQQNYGPPPQQNYGPPRQQNYGPPPQQNYGPPPQQNYGPPQQQNYGPPPTGNYRAQGQGEFPQGNQRSQVPPEQSGFSRDNHNFNPAQGDSFERGPVDAQGQAYGQNHPGHGDDQRGNAPAWEQRNFPSMGNTMTGQER